MAAAVAAPAPAVHAARTRAGPALLLALTLVVVLALSAATQLDEHAADPPPHARHLFEAVRGRASAREQSLAVQALLQRLLPGRAHLFGVAVEPDPGPTPPHAHRDTFRVVKQPGRPYVNITGNSGVAAAWGLHHYLTQVCGCHVSWDYDQLALPDPLPNVNVTVTAVDRYRYYQNVCTVSYSFVWWDWARWERELDWMALNGINMALAFSGQEAVWQRVYAQLGLSKEDVDHHFTGPAFLAWQRMGNVRGWAGPLSASWHAHSRLLQHRILSRMRALGMVAVLPAFAGHVPRSFHRLFPNSSTTPLQRWNHFSDEYCCPLLLDPTDPLFHRVGTLFMREVRVPVVQKNQSELKRIMRIIESVMPLPSTPNAQLIAEFGTDHIYNSDTFNEMQPADGRPEYLARVGRAVYDSLVDVDPEAVWMIQNWLFVHDAFWTEPRAAALLTSVPTGRMLVLDLMGEQKPQYRRFHSYYGQPFVWCMLHNFGGTLGMYGASQYVNRNAFEARAMAGSTMVGTGLTMEGTGQNYVMYDLANELAWRAEPANLTEWFSQYARRRYGAYHPAADASWQLLKDSVYSNKDTLYANHGRYALTQHPSADLQEPVWYRPEAVRDAWRQLLAAGGALRSSPNYRFDLVDLTRQGLQLAMAALYTQAVRAFHRRQRDPLRKSSEQVKQLFADLERILSTDTHFMLGPWLHSARERATNELEEAMYEWNARNQLTLWGPRGEIKDYAAKQWAGLVSRYYAPRWERYLEALERSLREGQPLNQTAVSHDIFVNVEEPFTLDRTAFPTEPTGDAVALSEELFERWSHLLTTKAVVRKPRPRKGSPAAQAPAPASVPEAEEFMATTEISVSAV
ncbi:Alpha-N-acetylglucosaminidase [Frankliniella fusca]|uniref:Alpha-N-acetylglucosaminidase n=1 Tax=Frankliniella fusca TaxID=407009 RepID=A0AAE1HIS8_9NEOP|nr:Alpha-N-acetylglucosaminidase [Frankliniella fusca]